MNTEFEYIVPWNGGNDTGRDARLKLQRNFEKVAANFVELVQNFESVDELIALIGEALDTKLSKVDNDTAAGIITLLQKLIAQQGVQFGESFASGMTGFGGLIDGDGYGELRGLRLWNWLEVPELRYNRAEVILGIKWRTPGAGIIESVDTVNKIITLKLEEGELGATALGGICMGFFHSVNSEDNAEVDSDDSKGNFTFAGFGTSYFRVAEILETGKNSKFRYALRPVSSKYPKQFEPQVGMHFAEYGNFIDTKRQTSVYETRTYQRMLWKQDDWEIGADNIAMQIGDLSNLNVHGLETEGYSAYLNNVYFTGKIIQTTPQGNVIKTIEDRGAWVSNPTEDYYNTDTVQSDVWHLSCRWRCLVTGTTEEPAWDAVDWQFVSGDTELVLNIESTRGTLFRLTAVNTTLVASVYKGLTDITDKIVDGEWVWTRDSGNATQDAAWNAQHTSDTRELPLTTVELGDNWFVSRSVTFTCTAYYRDGIDVKTVKNRFRFN